MAFAGDLAPKVQCKPLITRRDGTFFAIFSGNVTVSLSFDEAYNQGQMTGMVTPSYPRLSDSNFIKIVTGTEQAAMYIGNGFKCICDQTFIEFKSVERIQIGYQWIYGSNMDDMQCSARTMTGICIPKEVMQRSLLHYNVPYISALKSYVIARPTALQPRTAFLNGTKDAEMLPKESPTDALNRVIAAAASNTGRAGGASMTGGGASSNPSGGHSSASTAAASNTGRAGGGSTTGGGASSNPSGGLSAFFLPHAVTNRSLRSTENNMKSSKSSILDGIRNVKMDAKPSQSGLKELSDFDSNDQDSILGDNGDEGSKLGDEQKEIDFPDEANGGDLDGDDDDGDALLVAAKSFDTILLVLKMPKSVFI